MKLLIAFVVCFAVVAAQQEEEKVSYRGYRQIRLEPQTQKHLDLIKQWEEEDTEFDIWNHVRGISHNVDISLSPFKYVQYRILFVENDLPFTIITDDLQKRFDEEQEVLQSHRRDNRVVNTYATYDAIMNWLETVVNDNHPQLNIATYSVGKTAQGRDLKVIKIGTATSRRKIWIDCGIHAREWISPATCTYMINSLVNQYKAGDAVTTRILNH